MDCFCDLFKRICPFSLALYLGTRPPGSPLARGRGLSVVVFDSGTVHTLRWAKRIPAFVWPDCDEGEVQATAWAIGASAACLALTAVSYSAFMPWSSHSSLHW